jgi:hypothetical protein
MVMAAKQKLYSFIDKDSGAERYGTHIGTNSMGLYLVEVKGKGGEVVVLDKSELTPVVPHTVSVKSARGGAGKDFQIGVGVVTVGAVLVEFGAYDKMTFWVVTKLDTKAENAVKFKGMALAGATLIK